LIGDEGLLRLGSDLDGTAARLAAAGLTVDFLDRDGQSDALPGLRAPVERALFEPAAGAIRARRAIDFLKASVESTIVRSEVLGIEEAGGDGYRLLLADGFWRCERLVLCAGTETARFAGMVGIDIPVAVRWHPRASFSICASPPRSSFACLQDFSGNHGETVYGSPVGRTGLYAVGLVGPTSDTPFDAGAETPCMGLDTAGLIDRIVRYVEAAMKCLEPEPVEVRICPTTKLDAGKDAFAAYGKGGVTAIAGNNLFKFAPVLGQLLAQSAISGRIIEPLTVASGGVTAESL
jgi:sarcosine oxidase